MTPDQALQLPFINRDQLDFKGQATYELEIYSVSQNTDPLIVSGLTRAGAFNLTHIPSGGSAGLTEAFKIPDIPIMISVSLKSGSQYQGTTYVSVNLKINGIIIQNLLSGFVYSFKSISWPQTNSLDKIPDSGGLGIVSGTNPAAGADGKINVAGAEIWVIRSIAFKLVTDANVANRRVQIYNKSTTDFQYRWQTHTDQDQAASLTRYYTFANFGVIPAAIYDTSILAPMPVGLTVKTQEEITIHVANIQAGDAITNIRVERELYFV